MNIMDYLAINSFKNKAIKVPANFFELLLKETILGYIYLLKGHHIHGFYLKDLIMEETNGSTT